MNRHIERVWYYFEQDLVAVNDREAYRLLSFLRRVQREGGHYDVIEIYDLQRYKLVRNKNKVRNMLHLGTKDMAFIFPACVN